MRSAWRSVVLCGWLLGGCGGSKPSPVATPSEPNGLNVILIVVDTLRADHLESYGYALPNSSRIYGFARNAVVFDQSYAQSPWTKPSVASLLTSLEPSDHGVQQWEQQMTDEELTVTEVLQAQGYDTEAYIGHHALEQKYNNFHQGFDVFDVSAFKTFGSPHKIASSDRVTDLAIQAVKKKRDRPFFLWLHYFDPHDDYLKHESFDYGDRPENRYDSEIAFTDHHLGRLFQTLKQQDLYQNTIVILTADHGEEFMDHGHNRHTHTLYEEVVRVPLLIRAPGLAPAVVDAPIAGIDLAPTVLGMVGVPVPPPFAGRAIPVEDGHFQLDPGHPVFVETRREVDRQAVIQDRWKLIQDKVTGGYELYDLRVDPKERFNRYKKEPRRAAALRSLLDAHYAGPAAEAPQMAPDEEFNQLLEQLGYLDGAEE